MEIAWKKYPEKLSLNEFILSLWRNRLKIDKVFGFFKRDYYDWKVKISWYKENVSEKK